MLPTPSSTRHRSPAASRARRSGLAVAAGLAALTVGAPSAVAATEFYGVEVDATVRTTYAGSSDDPRLEHESSLSTSTRVTAGFLAVIERVPGGRIVGAAGEAQHDATTTGTIATREREFHASSNDWYERATSCTGAGPNRNDEGRTSLREDPLTPLVGASMILNLADRLDVNMDCTATGRHGGAGPGSFSLSSPLPEDPLNEPGGPLSVSFDLPEEATRAGKTIQLFRGPADGQAAYCPKALDEQAHRRSCRVTFEGTITLTRQDLGGTPPSTPAPGGPTVPTPGTPTRPAPSPGTGTPKPTTPATPSVPAGQRALLGGSGLRFRATCPTACTGTATVRVPVAGRTGRTRTVATVPVTVGAGSRARTVRVTLPRTARRVLARTTGATVVVALRPKGGRVARTTLKVRR